MKGNLTLVAMRIPCKRGKIKKDKLRHDYLKGLTGVIPNKDMPVENTLGRTTKNR